MASNMGHVRKHGKAVMAKAGRKRRGAGTSNTGSGRRKAGPKAEIKMKAAPIKGMDHGTG